MSGRADDPGIKRGEIRIDLQQRAEDDLGPLCDRLADLIEDPSEERSLEMLTAAALTNAYVLGARAAVAEYAATLIERGILNVQLDLSAMALADL
ncbi:MAG TPA: hypothetical protein VNT32_15575 [Thermoleophilaceae bacterium]|nr:hypothetical protein [Thermoleophilaceae bacterium]